MVTVWSKRAKNELAKAFEYISLESPQNDGSWRAFEKYRFRISYRVMEKEIRIVRFRHTSRTPLNY